MSNKLICWDANVLIYFLKGEFLGNKQYIMDVVNYVEENKYILGFSTLTYVEVLECTMSNETIQKFEKFMKNREKVSIYVVDIVIAKKAQQIRNVIKENIGKTISTPDAIHVATAIVNEAETFHTFDDDLLHLSEKQEVEGLSITACHIPGTDRSLF